MPSNPLSKNSNSLQHWTGCAPCLLHLRRERPDKSMTLRRLTCAQLSLAPTPRSSNQLEAIQPPKPHRPTHNFRGIRTMSPQSDLDFDPIKTFSSHFWGQKVTSWEKLNRGVSKPGCFPLFSGKVQIVSRTLSGLFLVGALNRPRKRERTNRKIPGPSPSKSGKSQKNRESPKKDKKGQNRKDKSRSGNPPVWNPPVWQPLNFGGNFWVALGETLKVTV